MNLLNTTDLQDTEYLSQDVRGSTRFGAQLSTCSLPPEDHHTLNLQDTLQAQQLCAQSNMEQHLPAKGTRQGEEGLQGLHSHLCAVLPPRLLEPSAPTTHLTQIRENLQQSQQGEHTPGCQQYKHVVCC